MTDLELIEVQAKNAAEIVRLEQENERLRGLLADCLPMIGAIGTTATDDFYFIRAAGVIEKKIEKALRAVH